MEAEKEKAQEVTTKKAVEKQAPIGLGDLELSGEARTELSLMPNCKNFAEVFQLCNWISESQIVPEAYRGRPADIFVAAEYGSDIGLKFMTAIQNIAIISGRPALPSDIKLAMVRGKHLLEWKKEASLDEIKKTGIAWCEMKRVDVQEVERHTWSVDDAKVAGVWEKLSRNGFAGPWVTHKWRMLQLKPRDMCLRDLFGDVFKGLHSVEEAQEIVMLNEAQTSQALIESFSQPETKGKEILAAPKPPLTPASAQAEPTKANDPPKESVQENAPAVTGALANLVAERCAKLRGLIAGSAALMKLWNEFKLPGAKFGKVEASSMLTADQLAAFNDRLTDLMIALDEKKKA